MKNKIFGQVFVALLIGIASGQSASAQHGEHGNNKPQSSGGEHGNSKPLSSGGEHGNGGGAELDNAGYVAQYMAYHYKIKRWLHQYYLDGTLAQKLLLDETRPFTADGRLVTARIVMEQFHRGGQATVEFLPRGHFVNEKVPGLPQNRICGNLPAERKIFCSMDEWDREVARIQASAKGRTSSKQQDREEAEYGDAIFAALDFHERLGVAGQLEQNDGPISKYIISSQILRFRHPLASDDDFDGILYTEPKFWSVPAIDYLSQSNLSLKFQCSADLACISKNSVSTCSGRSDYYLYLREKNSLTNNECLNQISRAVKQTDFFGGGCNEEIQPPTDPTLQMGTNQIFIYNRGVLIRILRCSYSDESKAWNPKLLPPFAGTFNPFLN